MLGLLTGNLRRGAEIKLTQYGVWNYFEFGAYADDHHDRNELGHFARRRASEKRGVDFPAERIYVLGDTPHDVACARAIGAKAVAIATGAFSREALAACEPDCPFEDLGNLSAVLQAMRMDGDLCGPGDPGNAGNTTLLSTASNPMSCSAQMALVSRSTTGHQNPPERIPIR